MTDQQMAKAFNMWMDEFTNHPEKFEQAVKTAMTHLKERADSKEPTYGERCVVLLKEYHTQLTSSASEGRKAG